MILFVFCLSHDWSWARLMLQPCVGVWMCLQSCMHACAFSFRVKSCSKRPSAGFTTHLSPLTCAPPHTHINNQLHLFLHSEYPRTTDLHSADRCFPSLWPVKAHLHACIHLHKNISPFLTLSPWCSCSALCDVGITSFPTGIQKCTHTYFTTVVTQSMKEQKNFTKQCKLTQTSYSVYNYILHIHLTQLSIRFLNLLYSCLWSQSCRSLPRDFKTKLVPTTPPHACTRATW